MADAGLGKGSWAKGVGYKGQGVQGTRVREATYDSLLWLTLLTWFYF